jgi:hypothetical protein
MRVLSAMGQLLRDAICGKTETFAMLAAGRQIVRR